MPTAELPSRHGILGFLFFECVIGRHRNCRELYRGDYDGVMVNLCTCPCHRRSRPFLIYTEV